MKTPVACTFAVALCLAASPAAPTDGGAPTDEEWKQAATTRLARNGHEECEARQVREWYRIRCRPAHGVLGSDRVIVAAGPIDDVDVKLTTAWDFSDLELTFPLRPGERRVLMAPGWLAVSALWLADAPAPTVVVD